MTERLLFVNDSIVKVAVVSYAKVKFTISLTNYVICSFLNFSLGKKLNFIICISFE